MKPVSQILISEHSVETGHKDDPDSSVWTSSSHSWLHMGSLKITVFSKLWLIQTRQDRVILMVGLRLYGGTDL